jgi:hypothetical protein
MTSLDCVLSVVPVFVDVATDCVERAVGTGRVTSEAGGRVGAAVGRTIGVNEFVELLAVKQRKRRTQYLF